MATLILTAVGTAIAGPIGGAIGAVIGQTADAALFAPKARQGPRLGDLSIQTSSYGTAIPKIFGTMRVAGCVIWATDLKESRSTSGGKGQPDTTSYSYSASFAVAISGRRIREVKRIWADGKLLRGAAGDFKSETGYRLYPGDEEQGADPFIASALGPAETPAFRGIAYAMFEGFQLGDYANRIPSLTFEVVAEEEPVSVGYVAEVISGRAVRNAATPGVIGYAASGDSVRSAVEALGDVAPLSLRDTGAFLAITSEVAPVVEVPKSVLEARGAWGAGGRSEMSRRAAGLIAGEVSVAYHDPARDYQTGLQRATRGGPAHRTERIALPAVLSAGSAKAVAERRLAALWTGRATAKLHLGWRRSGLRPGAHLRIEGEAGLWKVERWTLDRMVLSLELVRVESGAAAAAFASAGQAVTQADELHGATVLHLIEVPLAGEQIAAEPLLFVAAAGAEAGWRRANLLASFNDGAIWTSAGGTAGAAVIGAALNALPAGGSALIDHRAQVEVELLNAGMWLEARTDEALAAGANLALIGEELIQFGRAEPVGPGRFRLSRLLRGRRGTEWAAGLHDVGDVFVLLEPERLKVIRPSAGLIGATARVSGHGIGDAAGAVLSERPISGEAVRPPSPVHLRAERNRDGDIAIEWVRRSRSGWQWLSGSATPLVEEREAYRLALRGAGFERDVELSAPAYTYSVADQVADGLAGPLAISVVQLGTFAASRAASINFV